MTQAKAPKSQGDVSGADGAPFDADVAVTRAFVDHQSFLKTYLSRRIRGDQDAEDFTQEVYVRALQFARRENKVSNWRGILTRIAADLVVDGFRRRQTRAADMHVPLDSVDDPSDDDLNSPERILQGRQTLSQVERSLETLDRDCHRAFVCVRFHGHSYAEVAKDLGVDTIAVGRLIERASLHLTRAAIQNR